MARETRGSQQASASDATPSKRKRQSPSPAVPKLKVTLPSASAIAAAVAAESNAVEPETKRQKISLKLNAKPNGRSPSKSPVPDTKAAEDVKGEKEMQGLPLSSELRGALSLVIEQMALHLPAPLDGILSLSLPPNFDKTEENTLGHVLREDTLTWESLVSLLHIFCENLLVPCSYPNPMPALETFHQPIPPLPSHFRPHVIYNFCAGLHALMQETEPTDATVPDSRTAERWALVQRIPTSTGMTEWFTSAVDPRAVDKALKKAQNEGEACDTLLETLASKGDRFGNASAIALHAASVGSSTKVPTLAESVIRKASQKALRWKEVQAKRKGYFGSVTRGVTPVRGDSWTPSFAPTFDSSKCTGGTSYYSTLQAMHERARARQWYARTLLPEAQPAVGEAGWRGSVEQEGEPSDAVKSVPSVDDRLQDNAEWLSELHVWQQVRVRMGDSTPSDRELALADALTASLSRLTGNVKPYSMISEEEISAHDLARRLIPVASPSIRGTLDPKRPKALHDNSTSRARPGSQAPSASPMPAPPGSTPANSWPLGGSPYGYGRPASAAGPSTPGRPSQQNANYRPPNTSMYPSTPYSAPPSGSSPYARPPQQPITPVPGSASYPVRPGPGPSALRQSFGPGVPYAGSPGGGGNNPANGLMSHVGANYRPPR